MDMLGEPEHINISWFVRCGLQYFCFPLLLLYYRVKAILNMNVCWRYIFDFTCVYVFIFSAVYMMMCVHSFRTFVVIVFHLKYMLRCAMLQALCHGTRIPLLCTKLRNQHHDHGAATFVMHNHF